MFEQNAQNGKKDYFSQHKVISQDYIPFIGFWIYSSKKGP